MAIRFDKLPRDGNGIVQGAWRVLHADSDYHGELGPAIFAKGESIFPLAGRSLALLAAHFGENLYMEPWGDAPTHGWMLPPCVEFDVPEGIDWTPEPCPWRVAHVEEAEAEEDTVPPAPEDVTPGPSVPVDEVFEDDDEEEADEESDDLDGMELDELRVCAAELGIHVDGRYREAALRRKIRAALGV